MRRLLAERELTVEGPRSRAGPASRRRSVTVNLAESPLCWLHARGHLDDRLFAAGELLRGDYERAGLGARVTMRWDPVRIKGGGDGGLSPAERHIAAKARFDGAMAAAGRGLADVLWRVVCAGEGLPEAEKRWVGRCVVESWYCVWRWTGLPNSTAYREERHGSLPSAKIRRMRLCSSGRTSSANHGFFFIHPALRQDGWGRGK